MNKFATRRQYLINMFYATLNDQKLNLGIMLQLLGDLMAEELVWREILDPEEFHGKDTNEYMAFIEHRR